MTDKDLECSQTVLNFIEEDDNLGTIPSPMQTIMNEVLSRNGWGLDSPASDQYRVNGDMIGFTKYLNKKYDLGYSIELEDYRNLRDFFTNHSIPFYKRIITQLTRDLKLKQLL